MISSSCAICCWVVRESTMTSWFQLPSKTNGSYECLREACKTKSGECEITLPGKRVVKAKEMAAKLIPTAFEKS